jgi:hypothetical protein
MPPEIDSEPRPSLPATPLAIEHLAKEINLLRDELRGRDERILSVLMRIEGDYKLLLHEHQNLARRVLALEMNQESDPLIVRAKKRAAKVRKARKR